MITITRQQLMALAVAMIVANPAQADNIPPAGWYPVVVTAAHMKLYQTMCAPISDKMLQYIEIIVSRTTDAAWVRAQREVAWFAGLYNMEDRNGYCKQTKGNIDSTEQELEDGVTNERRPTEKRP